ncbi:hypothetical protein [Pseudarthrobacter phenanthrenivorans]|uniref:hypothetical protein n=1 Tax=Pseudarthrobacter phenanthrenivorans TaxID=361575 RepID=UPI002F35CAA8
MKLIILLEVNGVLNPNQELVGESKNPSPHLSDLKVALVRRLATKVRIAWVSTSPSEVIYCLEVQLGLEVNCGRQSSKHFPMGDTSYPPWNGPRLVPKVSEYGSNWAK